VLLLMTRPFFGNANHEWRTCGMCVKTRMKTTAKKKDRKEQEYFGKIFR